VDSYPVQYRNYKRCQTHTHSTLAWGPHPPALPCTAGPRGGHWHSYNCLCCLSSVWDHLYITISHPHSARPCAIPHFRNTQAAVFFASTTSIAIYNAKRCRCGPSSLRKKSGVVGSMSRAPQLSQMKKAGLVLRIFLPR
jgi:hypothetical protein